VQFCASDGHNVLTAYRLFTHFDVAPFVYTVNVAEGFNLPGFTFLVPAHPGGPRHIPEEQ